MPVPPRVPSLPKVPRCAPLPLPALLRAAILAAVPRTTNPCSPRSLPQSRSQREAAADRQPAGHVAARHGRWWPLEAPHAAGSPPPPPPRTWALVEGPGACGTRVGAAPVARLAPVPKSCVPCMWPSRVPGAARRDWSHLEPREAPARLLAARDRTVGGTRSPQPRPAPPVTCLRRLARAHVSTCHFWDILRLYEIVRVVTVSHERPNASHVRFICSP